MLSVDYIRNNKEQVSQGLVKKGKEVDLDAIISLDDTRKELIMKVQKLREERNAISVENPPSEKTIARGREIKDELKQVEVELFKAEDDLKKRLLEVPNVPLVHVHAGDESENKVLRQEGSPPKLTFKPKDHVALGLALNILDIERAAKVSGTRFAYLKNEGALLELAIVSYAMKTLAADGFTPILPPALIKKQMTDGLGYWQAGGNENYYLVHDVDEGNENPLYLVGTGEHSIVPMHSGEIIEGKSLPLRYAAFSSCFRREAGAAGKDTHGILRVHQFEKVEMVSFVTPDQDGTERKKMLAVSERFLTDLGLAYQVVQLAAGDLSAPAAETVDIETWIPSQEKYRETHSISTTTDFQARRFKIRYKNRPDEPTAFVHILNGTAVALGRIIVAILENNQREDGSVSIPAALHPYTGFTEIKPKA
jgi:seryl-tRNA synthetase